eukprot:gene2863-1848_t
MPQQNNNPPHTNVTYRPSKPTNTKTTNRKPQLKHKYHHTRSLPIKPSNNLQHSNHSFKQFTCSHYTPMQTYRCLWASIQAQHNQNEAPNKPLTKALTSNHKLPNMTQSQMPNNQPVNRTTTRNQPLITPHPHLSKSNISGTLQSAPKTTHKLIELPASKSSRSTPKPAFTLETTKIRTLSNQELLCQPKTPHPKSTRNYTTHKSNSKTKSVAPKHLCQHVRKTYENCARTARNRKPPSIYNSEHSLAPSTQSTSKSKPAASNPPGNQRPQVTNSRNLGHISPPKTRKTCSRPTNYPKYASHLLPQLKQQNQTYNAKTPLAPPETLPTKAINPDHNSESRKSPKTKKPILSPATPKVNIGDQKFKNSRLASGTHMTDPQIAQICAGNAYHATKSAAHHSGEAPMETFVCALGQLVTYCTQIQIDHQQNEILAL